ncbi:isochorismate synthase MenF [Moritella sp. F3]|uniref:isochorismate synthase n=1 Tax=Moritella sp. F3 TaxID=2718882 RepID=UPI0018E15E2B|nr:isochorismate synthase [Moritella sp. F3]GIC79409.1 menaquinone-specific isochorismate synthase [Moritella sp. F1]GIC80345.1 menaquinone-specific isochorismate synthase [Moritella sp. F3]
MLNLTAAITSLQQQVIQAQPEQTRISVNLQPLNSTELIEWLGAQVLFPQFYWQSRDGDEEVVALGECSHCHDVSLAKTLFTQPQRMWGGQAFSSKESNKEPSQSLSNTDNTGRNYYFLPQIELTRQQDQWQLSVNLPVAPVANHVMPETGYDKTQLLASLASLIAPAPIPLPQSYKIESRHHYPEFKQWSHLVTKALTAIDEQYFAKVVLARKTVLTLNRPLSATQFLQQSRQVNQQCFHFIFAIHADDYFVGSTPERLFSRDTDNLHTEALAGTAARSLDDVEDRALANWLLNDKKNRYENRLVTDDLLSRLQPRCQTLQVATCPELIKLRKVQHLKHKIDGQLMAGIDDAELLTSLQPTAAIAGLPRQPALTFIADNEPFDRGWYSGALGYIGQQHSEFCVAIRSARVLGRELQLFAGAGIVPGSDPQSEWQELERKTATLLTLLEPDTNDYHDEHSYHNYNKKQDHKHVLANQFASEQQRA